MKIEYVLKKLNESHWSFRRTNFQSGQDIEFRVIVTNDKAIFTNENLYMNSKNKNPADRPQHSID